MPQVFMHGDYFAVVVSIEYQAPLPHVARSVLHPQYQYFSSAKLDGRLPGKMGCKGTQGPYMSICSNR